MDCKQDWNELLRSAVRADGRTIYLLAKTASIDQAQLRRWYRGDCGIGLETAQRLAGVVGVRLVAGQLGECDR